MRRSLIRAPAAVAAVLLLSGGAAVVVPAVARAATFKVTRFDDPVPTRCSPSNCSLREAVAAADASHVASTILLRPGVYELQMTGSKPDLSQLTLGAEIMIRPARGHATIDAGAQHTGSRALEVTSRGQVMLERVSVRDGTGSPDADGIERGGAIRVDGGGSLTIRDGSVTASIAQGPGAEGGGIYIAPRGRATIDQSLIAGNSAFSGGGIANAGGELEVTDSLIQGNRASDGGGAYLNACAVSHFTYTTLTGNIASAHGGALRDANASTFLLHATISANRADVNGGGVTARVLQPFGCPTELFLNDTIIARNKASHGGASPDCRDESGADDIFSHGYNLIGDETGCGVSASGGDQFGSGSKPLNPRLGPLHDNGGPTETMALRPGSRAIGKANPVLCGASDQRGYVIAHDGDRESCDIGAYEVFYPPRRLLAPVIKGDARVGARLRCTAGKWAGATPLHFGFGWERDGKTIRGATSSGYTVRSRDRSHHLRCVVTATDIAGSASARSAAIRT